MSTEFRLLKLERRLPRRPSPAPDPFAWHRLTAEEAAELDALVGACRPSAGDRWGVRALTDEQLDRLAALRRKGDGLPADPNDVS